jgi:GH15 family glucan-1,4-alpha-glucosidase
MSTPLEDYALIGDCETAALVSKGGSIDWLCWPRFDSGACFAALLGGPEHGRWLIEAVDSDARVSRRYRDQTLILETLIETTDGTARLVDFMPPRGRNSDIVRIVVGERGRVRMRTELVLRFDYGALVPWVTRMDDGTLRVIAGPEMVVLRTTALLRGEELKTVGDFVLSEGQMVPFVLLPGNKEMAHDSSCRRYPRAPLRTVGVEVGSMWRTWASEQVFYLDGEALRDAIGMSRSAVHSWTFMVLSPDREKSRKRLECLSEVLRTDVNGRRDAEPTEVFLHPGVGVSAARGVQVHQEIPVGIELA